MSKIPAAAAVLLALTASLLPAQTYVSFRDEWESVTMKAPWTLGPFRLFPGLSLRNVGYDDNVFFESAPKPDYTGTFSPDLRIYLPVGGTILLFGSANPEYTYYVHEPTRRSFDFSWTGGLKALLLSRFVLTGEYRDESHRRRLSSEVGALVTDSSRGWDAGLSFETANRTVFGLSAFRHDVSYEAYSPDPEGVTLSDALNRTEMGGRAEINYRAFYQGYLFLGFEATDYAFQSPAMAWRNATGRRIYAGLRFPVGASIEGLLSLGYKQFRPEAEGQASFSGFVGSANVSARFGRFGLRARFGRDNVFSAYTDVLYFLEASVGGGVSFYLAEFVRLDYDFDAGLTSYPEAESAVVAEGGFAGRDDRHTNHAVGLVFRILRTAGIGLTWNRATWTSTLPGWDRKRSFIGAYLTYRF